MKVLIIGSGPCGVACAKGLLERGCNVTMMDAGEGLDAERRELIDELGKLEPREWDPAAVARLKYNPSFSQPGVPRRRLFGSDFVFAGDRQYARLEVKDTSITSTYAKGGFSTVWGASVLPIAESDMRDWPFGMSTLDPYYRRVMRDLPLSAEPGNHETHFPIFKENIETIPLPAQCAQLLERMRTHESSLVAQGMRFGRSRLAVSNRQSDPEHGCISCGLCLYGCVPGAIYNSATEVETLRRTQSLEYISGRIVRAVTERADSTRVSWRDAMGATGSADFAAVFVAAGAINTTRLLLKLPNIRGQRVNLLDSQKCMLPLVNVRATKGAVSEVAPIMAGAFIDLHPSDIDEHWVHTQVYAVNEPMLQRLRVADASRNRILRTVLSPVLNRSMLAWLSLHSDHSGTIAAQLDKDGEILTLTAQENPRTKTHANRVAKRLFRLGLNFGTVFAWPAMQMVEPGSGHHVGGSFPMKREPRARTDTDIWGRPPGHSRLFAVDSTVMPSIAATTITLPAMANAWRIGREAPLPV